MDDEQSRATETKANQKSPSETWNTHGGSELGNIVFGVLAPVNAKLLT
jgi:ABC-type phosphate/phosphonate transport system permease subunit